MTTTTFTFNTPIGLNGKQMDWIEAMQALQNRVSCAGGPEPIGDGLREFFTDFGYDPGSTGAFLFWLGAAERCRSGVDIVEEMDTRLKMPAHSRLAKTQEEAANGTK